MGIGLSLSHDRHEQRTHSQALHFTCKIKQGGNFNKLGLPSNTAALEVARVCVNKCVLSRFENIINSSLNCITTKSVGDLPLRSLGFLLPRHLVPSPSYCGMISQKLAKYLLYKIIQPLAKSFYNIKLLGQKLIKRSQ